jgi:hypothetical protein
MSEWLYACLGKIATAIEEACRAQDEGGKLPYMAHSAFQGESYARP